MRSGKGGKYVKNPWLSPLFFSLTNVFVSLPCQISLLLLHVKSASHAFISDLTVSSKTNIYFFQVKSACLFSMSNLCLLSTSDFPISIPCQIFCFFCMSNLFVINAPALSTSPPLHMLPSTYPTLLLFYIDTRLCVSVY